MRMASEWRGRGNCDDSEKREEATYDPCSGIAAHFKVNTSKYAPLAPSKNKKNIPLSS